jgi:hypothetical protein
VWIEYVDTFVLGVGVTILTCVVVVITASITAVKIRQAAAWRVKTSSAMHGQGGNSIVLQKTLEKE